MNRQLISQEDKLLSLSRVDLKGETEREITAAQDQAFKPNIMGQKFNKRNTILAKGKNVNNMTECVLNYTLT
jgi:hypothetical protein